MKKLSKQVEILQQDYYTKKITTEAFLKIMLFVQLHETASLHAISDALLDDDFQRAIGFQAISASQLSRKNNEVDPSILATVFLDLVSQIHALQNQSRKTIPLKIIDSTTLPLNLTHFKWATFRKSKAGVKLHLRLVYMGKDKVYPNKAITTTAAEHDRNQLEVLVEVHDTKGNVLRLITNRFDLSSDEISRSRWAIELFFKWLKQHIEIKHFYGMTENALQNQIYIALITYCLHVLIRLEVGNKRQSLLGISR